MKISRSGSQPSAKGPPEWFTGTVRIDPLFTVVFICATVVNLIPGLVPSPTRVQLVALALLHVAFLVRLVRARGAAARQRAVELESYRAIKSEHPAAKT